MYFNEGWTFYKEGNEDKKIVLSVPHDAMLSEKRDIDNPGGANISYFGGGKYYYEKDFSLSLKEGEKVFFEFEGVYHQTEIFLNGKKAYFRQNGYMDFIFDATEFVSSGRNHIKVIVENSDQPNSRWYTGSGIYRPVHLYVLPKVHIQPRSVKIFTLDYQKGLIKVVASFSKKTDATLEILDKDGKNVFSKKIKNSDSLQETIEIPSFHLWNIDSPYLYQAVIRLEEDEAIENFGIREIKLDKEKGLLINGKREILYGACIHHDNGLLGACCDPFAEERKARILKNAGYNAIRSAHNPISKAFLDACDKIGLFVMDEYADCWYIHKTKYDYASFALDNYKEDLKDMVDKDFNHPSVILYSEGNEVAETSQKKGIEFVKTMTRYLHSLDSTRPCTCGVNIFFNALFSWGFGVYSDEKAKKETKAKKKKSVGSEFFNNLAGILGAGFMKTGATLPQSDRKTIEAFSKLDVAGYNYGIKRYQHDLKKYPSRFILGSETFCADAGKFYSLAIKNPRIIGDFVWAGWDYIGEAGIGSWVALKDKSILDDKAGWLLAGSGRIDILGSENAEMEYTRTAFRKEVIALACVSPKDYKAGHSPSSWKLSWALNSYDFPSCEGMKTQVEVYSQADKISLYQNGRLIGSRRKGKNPDGLYRFKIRYQPGTLEAVAYDSSGEEITRKLLSSSKGETKFVLSPEQETLKREGELAYIWLLFTDEKGNVRPLENEEIQVLDVKNGTLLGLGNGCPYYKGSYLDSKTTSYYGKALAIVRPKKEGDYLEFIARTRYGTSSCKISLLDGKAKEDKHI